jgi:hypothetical protein
VELTTGIGEPSGSFTDGIDKSNFDMVLENVAVGK